MFYQARKLVSVFFTLTLLLKTLPGSCQITDTLKLTVPQAEQIFLQKNLTLLATHYNIDINKALVQQAKVWDNPVLNSDQTLYDGKFFRHTHVNGVEYGEVFLQVQQLIRTAGKIHKQTVLAEDNVRAAEAQFADVMRNLRLTLITDLNELARLQHTASVYGNEMESMEGLVRGMDEMLKLGDVSQKENVRIRALLFSLRGDLSDNLRQQFDLEKELSGLLMLKDSIWISSSADKYFTQDQVEAIQLGMLKDSALAHRPDLQLLSAQKSFQQHNLSLQKALQYPDFSVGVQYDHLNSYVHNYFGLDLSVPLPIFSRNKGNILAADITANQYGIALEQLQNQVGHEVASAWMKLSNTTGLLNEGNSQLETSYEILLKNMVNSYRERKVGLIEFIDFFDAYRETRVRQWKLVADQRNAAAELNYVTNQNMITL